MNFQPALTSYYLCLLTPVSFARFLPNAPPCMLPFVVTLASKFRPEEKFVLPNNTDNHARLINGKSQMKPPAWRGIISR